MSRHPMLRLGTVVYGLGQSQSSWLDPSLNLKSEISFEYQRRVVQLAEQAKLDFVFIGDNPYCGLDSWPAMMSHFEPITLLAALAVVTSHIGLIPSISTSFAEPYNVARQLASLDHLSGGRAGWNLVTTAHPGAAKNFNLSEHIAHDERYVRAEEHLEIVRGLWDSWEDDAFVRDRGTRRYFDASKLHPLNHVGKYFSVAGPLCIERPPQGHPVIAQAGGSPTGIAFAARNAEIIFTGARSFEITQQHYRAVRTAARAAGRSPDALIITPGVAPIIGSTDEEAERRFEALKELPSIEEALVDLRDRFAGHDFSQYDLDAPFPDLGEIGAEGWQSRTNQIKQKAAANNLTLRQVAMDQMIPRSDFIGCPERIADRMEKWFRDDAADGFILNVGNNDSLADFVTHVLPILQQRGLFRRDYVGPTLRENLGIPRPKNRHAEA